MGVIINISGLSKSFTRSILTRSGNQELESNKVIRDLNLEITKGQVTSIIGGNGAGKSTLLNLIQNYTKPDSGEINFLFDNKKPVSFHFIFISQFFLAKI